MAKLSGNYEVVFILNPNLDEEATAAMVAKFKTLVEQNGTLAEVEDCLLYTSIWPPCPPLW